MVRTVPETMGHRRFVFFGFPSLQHGQSKLKAFVTKKKKLKALMLVQLQNGTWSMKLNYRAIKKLFFSELWQVNMSIAILPMSAEYNWNPGTVGLIQSSFFWGYLLTQVNYITFFYILQMNIWAMEKLKPLAL